MTDFFHHAAGAALPVAIALLVLAAMAAVILRSSSCDEPARDIARHYLEPLTTWCLVALGVYTLAHGAAGDATTISFALPLALGAAAALVRSAGEQESGAELMGAEQPAPTQAQTAPLPAPVPARPRTLWANPVDPIGNESAPDRRVV